MAENLHGMANDTNAEADFVWVKRLGVYWVISLEDIGRILLYLGGAVAVAGGLFFWKGHNLFRPGSYRDRLYDYFPPGTSLRTFDQVSVMWPQSNAPSGRKTPEGSPKSRNPNQPIDRMPSVLSAAGA